MESTKITARTIASTAVLALALVNQVLSACGKPVIPIEDSQLETVVTTALTVGASVWGWWNNNSVTQNAIKADQYLDKLNGKQ